MTLYLAACGAEGDTEDSGGAEDSKGIKLTVDNYDQYLNLDVKTLCSGPLFFYPSGVSITDFCTAVMLYGSVAVIMNVSGTSTDFNFNDVKIKISATVTYYSDTCENGFADIQTNKAAYKFASETKMDIVGKCNVMIDKCQLPDGCYTHEYLVSADYKITEITGTVTPA